MSTSKSNLEIVRAHYDASTNGDTKAMMADVAPDVRWTEMAGFPCAGTWVGTQAVLDNVFGVLGRDWKDYRFEPETLLDAGDHIIGVGVYQGEYRATKKSMRARVTHIWTIKDGKVIAFEQFTDTLLVRQAMV
ncbi:MAG TPA: nuclear transport factor 2 family protein [Duganella sp.]|uniref:nuclear transport factor 2 family protein n=1 Tax=Duganella sp. TaxID=1904440 RepID=UPI002ED2AC10